MSSNMSKRAEREDELIRDLPAKSGGCRVLDDHYVIVGNWALPRRYEAVMIEEDQPTIRLEIAVDDGGHLRCESISIRAEEGQELRTKQIRVPLERLVQDSTSSAFEPAVCVGEDGKLEALATMRPEHIEQMRRTLKQTKRPSRGPGARVPDAELQRVAEIYRAACAEGKPPVTAVEFELPASRATAGRRIKEARRRGFLGPAVGTRAGEAADDERKDS